MNESEYKTRYQIDPTYELYLVYHPPGLFLSLRISVGRVYFNMNYVFLIKALHGGFFWLLQYKMYTNNLLIKLLLY